MSEFKDIGCGIRSKQTEGAFVRLTLGGGLLSTKEELSTSELLYLLHALSRTKYTEITTGQSGFPYTFPFNFGD